MIKNYYLRFLIFCCAVSFGYGQVNENFDGWGNGSYAGISAYTSASGIWETNNSITDSENARSGNAVRFNYDSGADEYLLYSGLDGNGKDGGIGVISFWYRHWDGQPSNIEFQVQFSTNNGTTWVNVGSVVNPTTITYTQFSSTVNVAGEDILVRVISIADNERLLIDDFSITDFSGVSTPTINVSPASLAGMTYVAGNGPSVPSTAFNVSGIYLTDDISITPPSNYEVSINNTTWFSNPSSLNVPESGGTVSSTPIYVRLRAPLPRGLYNLEDIIITSTGATLNTVACFGSVTGSNNSDIVAVVASESPSISSTINNITPLNSTQGVQVWEITVRDGGASAPDSDNLSTFLTALTFAQASGNQVTTWTDAIESIALFNGTTRLATGNVTANQIQFSGMNFEVADDTQTTLAIRLSLKCPLGADTFDNEDFVFSLSNANTTFSSAGSGKTNFSAIGSANGLNRIDIAAIRLEFATQPTTTGINSPMSNVLVTALDACGNIDRDFTDSVSLTSGGTMTGAPIVLAMINGQATFFGIVHTATASGIRLTAVATGVATVLSSAFNITDTTTLLPGDLAVLAVNTNINAGDDRISFVIFKDITVNTDLYLTDNGYERRYADRWGSSEGVIRIRRTGSTLPAGTIITIEGNNSSAITNGSQYDVYTCGVIDTNWNKWALTGSGVSGFNLNDNDDLWFMQGGTWSNSPGTGLGDVCSGIDVDPYHNSTYNGNVLYGWTGSGWNLSPGGCISGSLATRWSTRYPTLECFNTVAPTGDGKVKFNDPNDPDFSLTTNSRIDWIVLINDTSHWDSYGDNVVYDGVGYDYKLNTTCPAITIATSGYVNGKWIGRKDTNWFDCANWDTFIVPDETVDVLIEDHPTFNNHAHIDATATYADNYGNIAKVRNLAITGDKVEISGNTNNILEVYGNLIIDNSGSGSIDMNDGNPATADGQLFIRGNWTNGRDETAFDEGNGTVIFNGTATQSISFGGPPIPPLPFESEIFNNVILENDFDIGTTDRTFYLNGDLTIATTGSLNVQSDQFVYVGNILTVNSPGEFTLEDSASLIQVNDVNNVGNISMERSVSIRQQDYVYWSSPVSNFNVNDISTGTSSNYIYKWNPSIANGAGGQGNWESANGDIMDAGAGYIVRGPNAFNNVSALNFDAVFNNGNPNNGDVIVPVSRGSLPGDDDDWNLVGNPYPSAINALEFLIQNLNLEGFINIWTHGSLPSSAIGDPFYESNGGFNYDQNDYITYNGTATTSGPSGFNGDIAAAQSFMVNLEDVGPANQNITFRNSLRGVLQDNNQFYRSVNDSEGIEKHCIWLDLAPEGSDIAERLVLGYVSEATMHKDRLYDAEWTGSEDDGAFYSLIGTDSFLIQGRGLPFVDTDRVPLGFKAQTTGNYTIGIFAVEGLFDSQTIYLIDQDLNFIHNLTTNPYMFTSEIGKFNDRFQIVFRADALSIDDNFIDANELTILELANGDVRFEVGNHLNIISVQILDVSGRQIYNLKGNASTEVYALSQLSKAVYIAKVTLSNGHVIIKKVIKQR